MVAAGRPADVILDTASREDVQLIVMGVQARSAWDRLLFGSTTRRVMQAATCPVLTIRAGDAAEAWPPSPHRDAGVGERVNSPETAAPTLQHSATTPGR
jgi:K+-sensing histidine kinase KdpD